MAKKPALCVDLVAPFAVPQAPRTWPDMNLLRRRKNSRFFYFRQRIPTDLVFAYEGKKEVNLSLGTSDLAEAKRLAHLKAVEFANEWEKKRRELRLPITHGPKF